MCCQCDNDSIHGQCRQHILDLGQHKTTDTQEGPRLRCYYMGSPKRIFGDYHPDTLGSSHGDTGHSSNPSI